MDTIFKRTIPNDIYSLQTLMNASTNFLEDQGVDDQSVYRINLALEEMITNTIKHGYNDYEDHEIQVSIEVLNDEIVGIIEDNGHEFDPLTQNDTERKASLEELPIGGLGIHLIKKMLSHMAYKREGDRNILEVRMKRNSTEG